jgi:alpha/beta superfamily hydrolase
MSNPVVRTPDGIRLQTIYEEPIGATRSVLVCHPHPEHGGSMTHPMMDAIATRQLADGDAVMRFNFRGVGESTGEHGGGPSEVVDIASVAAWLDEEGAPLGGIVGWSFGAAVALIWQAQSGTALPYVGIAPPVDSPLTPTLPAPERLLPARRTFIIGDRDQFIDATELAMYGDTIGASTVRYETADHFFIFRYDRLADDVAQGLSGDQLR